MGLTVFSTFVVADFLFLAGGALLLGFALVEQADMSEAANKGNAVRNLLFLYSPAPGMPPDPLSLSVAH